MKIVTWNVRGFNKVHKQKEMKIFLEKQKINLIAIVEHRVQNAKEKEVINKCAPGWSWCSNSKATERGRIWILWDANSIQFTMLQSHTQYIHGIIKNNSSSKQFAFTAIYGLHTAAHMCDMLEELRKIDSQMDSPWLLTGDFNAVLDKEDRVNGTEIQDNKIKDFRALMEDCRLNELRTVGRTYTWTNNYVFSRIDRAIVNAHWMMNMPPLQVCVMDPHFSDHSPLCIEVETGMEYKGRPFKFFNCFTEHPEFEEIIRSRWEKENSTMKDIWCNLKQIKEEMKRLNKREFSNTIKKVQQLREELANIQARMRTTKHSS
ncbi:PREDICTED: uncharacterized protein LOC109224111 [Nicotiana attenuata]|uniref:uncharacterized protein LOC109224111 n=1 Tax=Nicotiana attenuata TaxID=49451 RepID=UPI0009056068|nr:PREDICTED: uncharacterized protein LOC109224111 [Nicotiana attenuata]